MDKIYLFSWQKNIMGHDMSIDIYLRKDEPGKSITGRDAPMLISHQAAIDMKVLAEFRKIHDPHITMESNRHALRIPYNYIYIPSHISTGIMLECRCGEKKDVSDYGCW